MRKRPNEQNERIKRRFVEYCKHARQLSEKSLDKELAALERFDVWNGEGFLMRVAVERFALARQPPALENLPRTKPRGSWHNLWGKCADG